MMQRSPVYPRADTADAHSSEHVELMCSRPPIHVTYVRAHGQARKETMCLSLTDGTPQFYGTPYIFFEHNFVRFSFKATTTYVLHSRLRVYERASASSDKEGKEPASKCLVSRAPCIPRERGKSRHEIDKLCC